MVGENILTLSYYSPDIISTNDSPTSPPNLSAATPIVPDTNNPHVSASAPHASIEIIPNAKEQTAVAAPFSTITLATAEPASPPLNLAADATFLSLAFQAKFCDRMRYKMLYES